MGDIDGNGNGDIRAEELHANKPVEHCPRVNSQQRWPFIIESPELLLFCPVVKANDSPNITNIRYNIPTK